MERDIDVIMDSWPEEENQEQAAEKPTEPSGSDNSDDNPNPSSLPEGGEGGEGDEPTEDENGNPIGTEYDDEGNATNLDDEGIIIIDDKGSSDDEGEEDENGNPVGTEYDDEGNPTNLDEDGNIININDDEPKPNNDEPKDFTPNAELLELVQEEGKEFKTQEEFETHLTEKFKFMYKQATQFNEVSSKLSGIIKKNSELGSLIKSLGEGKDMLSALVEAGIPDLIPEDGDFDSEDYKAKMAERAKAQEKTASEQEQLNTRVQQSDADIHTFINDNKLGDDFRSKVYDLAQEINQGVISKELLSVLNKGFTYDQEVEKLQKEVNNKIESARVQERNKKIVKQKQLKSKEKDIPDINSRTGKDAKKSKELSEVDELAMQLNSNYV